MVGIVHQPTLPTYYHKAYVRVTVTSLHFYVFDISYLNIENYMQSVCHDC
jgi:hypothetical protein